MKILSLTTALALLAAVGHAQGYGSGVDGQSVFRVSDTLAPLTVGATSVRSEKLASETRVIRLTCTEACHYRVGGSGVTATPSNTLLVGGASEYFKVPATGANYVAAIRASADGKLFIDQMVP
ncbi:MAG: hypothetical protein R3D70_05810 [Rhizobiaceae bacterium]